MPAPKPEGRKSNSLRLRFPPEGHIAEAAPAAAPTTPQAPDMFMLLRALGRRWLLFVLVGSVAATGAAAAGWFLLAPKHTAFAQLHVAANAPRMVFKTADSTEGRNDFLTYMRTQSARVKSRYVLNAALKAETVKQLPLVTEQTDPVAWLDEELKVEFTDNSEILTVSLAGREPQSVVAVVNAVTQAYLQEIENQERKLRSRRVAELDNIYVAAKEKLRVKRETLRRRADELGTSDSQAMTQRQLLQLSSLGDIRKQYGQVRFELLQARGRLVAHELRIKNPLPVAIPENVVEERLALDEVARTHRTRLTKLQEIIRDYEQHALNPNEGTLVRARTHHAAAQKEIDQRRAAIEQTLSTEQRRKQEVELKANVEGLKDTVAVLLQQEKSLREEMEQLNRDAEKIGRTSTEVELLSSEIKQEEKLSQQVADELEALQVELRSPNRVNLAQEAALQPTSLKKQIGATVIAALAAFAGIGLAIGYWEFLRRRVHTPEEVSRGLGLRVIGAVPTRSIARGQGEDADQRVRESIHSIRAMLLREARLQDTHAVMVTSADTGEGKTTLAGQLATSLAQAGQKTLLVDGDLRAPTLHQLFETTAQPGLTEVLLGEVALEDAVRPTSIDGLSFLPAGEWDGDVVKALAGEGMSQMIERLKQQFDLILIDSHPVLETTDSLLLGQHVDAVLLSLLREVSQVPRAQAAIQELGNMGIRVLGAVVNGIRSGDAIVRGRTTMVRPVVNS
jgi:succinoglycan biosynthesis transport protein ExoP